MSKASQFTSQTKGFIPPMRSNGQEMRAPGRFREAQTGGFGQPQPRSPVVPSEVNEIKTDDMRPTGRWN